MDRNVWNERYAGDELVWSAALDGLEIVKAERVERPVQSDDGNKIAIDALVRATRPARSRR